MNHKGTLFYWAILYQFLFNFSAFAFELKQGKNGEVILKASSCVELQTKVATIAEWTQSLDSETKGVGVDCKQTPDLSEIDISPLIPKRVSKHYTSHPACEGGNCTNTALLAAGLNQFPRYTGFAEWRNILEGKQCKLRSEGKPERGDLVTIVEEVGKSATGKPIKLDTHGFIYIDGDIAFSKNGHAITELPSFYSFEFVLSGYNVPKDSRCRNPSAIPDSHCKTYVSFYQCKAPEGSTSKWSRLEEPLSACLRDLGRREEAYKLVESFKDITQMFKEGKSDRSVEFSEEERLALSSIRFQLDALLFAHLYHSPKTQKNSGSVESKHSSSEIHELKGAGSDEFSLKGKYNMSGETRLTQACLDGDFDKIKSFLEAGDRANEKNLKNELPINILWRASNPKTHISLNSKEIARIMSILLEHGAEVDEGPGVNTLTTAVINRNAEVVQMLLKKGVKRIGPKGMRILDYTNRIYNFAGRNTDLDSNEKEILQLFENADSERKM